MALHRCSMSSTGSLRNWDCCATALKNALQLKRLDPGIGNAATLFTRPLRVAALPLRNLALFYIALVPLLLGFGTALLLSRLGLQVNWLNLTLYLVLFILMTTAFSIGFCVAFLLPFSVVLDAGGRARQRRLGESHYDELVRWASEAGAG